MKIKIRLAGSCFPASGLVAEVEVKQIEFQGTFWSIGTGYEIEPVYDDSIQDKRSIRDFFGQDLKLVEFK